MENIKQIVQDGYDHISYRYRDDAGNSELEDSTTQYKAWLAHLLPFITLNDPVLDIGCGCGVPVAQVLIEHTNAYMGVDISPVQIERAQALVPAGNFVCTDITTLDLPTAYFAGIVAFYSIIHIPLPEQPSLFDKMVRWLRPGGYFLGTVGERAWTGQDEDWLGTPMYWSHANAQTYKAWLQERHFTILWSQFVPEGNGGHRLFFAQKKPNK